jgi:hypothetical protein
MSRALYRLLVHLHPRGFRDRFEDEMLAVYDDAVAAHGGFRLAASTLFSLVRQWLRPSPVNGMAASAATMRAYGICRTRQRLEIVAHLVPMGGFVVHHLLFVDMDNARLALMVSFVASWGSCALAPAMWRRVRSPQEYERARRRPGLREELERKAQTMWTNRVLMWGAWLCTAILVVGLAAFLRNPEWKQWNGLPGALMFIGSVGLLQFWLQRRLAGTLQHELNQIAPLADSSRP